MATRQKKDINLEKKAVIQKDFALVEKVLNGESLDTQTVLSKKLKTLVTATVQYSGNLWHESCISLYNLYAVSPRATPLLSEHIKQCLRNAAMLYKKAGKNSNIFFQNYLNRVKNEHS